MSLAVVRDLRVARAPVTAEDLAALQTDVLAGFVLARAAAGLPDGTIASDVLHLEQVRAWFGRPLWDMEPADADAYFGKVLRDTAKGTQLSRAQALKTCFLFLELRHRAEIHQMTGRIVECPIDEMNRPRGRQQAKLRIPPTAAQVDRLFAGWREELATCRKFAPAARNYTACRLLSEVGLRVNEACKLDLPDIKWELGRFGKLHVRQGKGARGSGPRERMVPLINNAGQTLRWFVEDVGPVRRRPHPARCAAAAVRTQERRRHRLPDRRRDTPLGAGQGRRDAPAGLARRGHAARPASVRCCRSSTPRRSGFAAAHLRGAPRRLRGRSSGLQGAAHRAGARQPCGLPWTPETSAAPGVRKSGQAQGLPLARRTAREPAVAGGCATRTPGNKVNWRSINKEGGKITQIQAWAQVR